MVRNQKNVFTTNTVYVVFNELLVPFAVLNLIKMVQKIIKVTTKVVEVQMVLVLFLNKPVQNQKNEEDNNKVVMPVENIQLDRVVN